MKEKFAAFRFCSSSICYFLAFHLCLNIRLSHQNYFMQSIMLFVAYQQIRHRIRHVREFKIPLILRPLSLFPRYRVKVFYQIPAMRGNHQSNRIIGSFQKRINPLNPINDRRIGARKNHFHRYPLFGFDNQVVRNVGRGLPLPSCRIPVGNKLSSHATIFCNQNIECRTRKVLDIFRTIL